MAAAIRGAKTARVGLLLGGGATRGAALATAGRIAEAHGVRLLGEVFVNRAERGHGRAKLARIPYPVDAALAALQDIDVLVLVAAAPPVAFFAYPNKPSRLVRPDCLTLSLAAPGDDLAACLLALEDALGRGSGQGHPQAQAEPAPTQPAGVLTEDAIAILVAACLPEQAIVCDEALTSARRFFALTAEAAPHDYLMNTGGAIGIGIPLATGAAVACPDRKVVSLQADGSGLYTLQGLWTQAREHLDVVTIILANNAYAILQAEMHAVGVRQFGRNAARMLTLDEPRLDWVSLAAGFGVEAARATTCERFTELLDLALKRRGPFLIEAVI